MEAPPPEVRLSLSKKSISFDVLLDVEASVQRGNTVWVDSEERFVVIPPLRQGETNHPTVFDLVLFCHVVDVLG
jgi:DNA/RNA-binding domain of Phe-tRNA-synthetase-like protein